MNIADRAAGAVVGALVGDALGLGPHWYYDLTELRKDYGDWITGYTAPRPGRYHGGMTPGQLSHTGLIIVMLLRSVVGIKGLSQKLFSKTAIHGPAVSWLALNFWRPTA